MTVILASKSPRRQELLRTFVPEFSICPAEIDEILDPSLSLEAGVLKIALEKAEFIAKQQPQAVVISADTLVVCGEQVFGKPENEQEAAEMLSSLSGKTHRVLTALVLLSPNRVQQEVSCSEITFLPISREEILWYIATGEPMDKAGAYGIQGIGAAFISHIQGDFFATMGLPMAKLYGMLKNINFFAE